MGFSMVEDEEAEEMDENGDTEWFLDAGQSLLLLLSTGYIFSASSFFGSKPL